MNLVIYLTCFIIVLQVLEIKGQRCPAHPKPKFGFSECSNLRKHKSMCESKCKNGYKLDGPSRMMCWCTTDKCAWTGMKATCKKFDCPTPDVISGSLRFADKWEGGFAGLVEFTEVAPTPDSDYGWAIVIIFDKPLGKKVTLLSWNLAISATSYDGQTFTFVNPENRVELSHFVDDDGRLSPLIVAEGLEGKNPQSAFVGLYYRRVRDATCLTAPRMPHIRPLYKEDKAGNIVLPRPGTIENPKTTTTKKPAIATTKKLRDRISQNPKTTTTKSSPTTTTSTQPQPASPKTTSTTTKALATDTTRPTTTSSTTSPSRRPDPVSQTKSEDGSFCNMQKHEDYFVAQPGWEDRGQHHFKGNIYLFTNEDLLDWRMVVVFEESVTKIETWACEVVHNSEDGKIWTFGPHPWNTKLNSGETDILFIATQAYATVGLAKAEVFLCSDSYTSGDSIIGGTGLGLTGGSGNKYTTTPAPEARTQTTTTNAPKKQCSPSSPRGRPVIRAGQTKLDFKPNNDGTKYNYNEVIHKSILFYEVQRSGAMPANNRIPWRGDSSLKDGCDIGIDATGGWFDAGDMVKFHFPMAYTLTTLAFGGIYFRDAYEDAGELENLIDSIKWPTEYFIKTHISKYKLVGQIGHGQTDHNYWGRPEQMTMNRPTYVLTEKKPGTEVAAETAAALAASSIFLRPTDPKLADQALAHSKQIFEFADKFRGVYSHSIPDAALYYKSYSGYHDELVWAAAWLYKATNDTKYLTAAEKFYERMNGKNKVPAEFSWDDKLPGAQVLLAEITGKDDYRKPFSQFLNNLPRRKKTPQGLYYLGDWGTNRYAANAAFMLILGSRLKPSLPKKSDYMRWAEKQIGLLLGDAGRSYVVGFGKDPPQRAHHASSSCPPYPERCDWTTYHSSKPNHYILYGALVGGPNQKGVYVDNRASYQETEVACDYNAGFQSAVAGLKQHAMKSKKIETTTPKPTTTSTKSTPDTTAKPKFNCKPKRSRKCIKARMAAKKSGRQ